jgi:chromosomal replication initiation ATPase DnaA
MNDLATIDRKIAELIKQRAALTHRQQLIDVLLIYVSAVCGVPVSHIKSKRRNRMVSDARCLLIYNLYESGYTKSMISTSLKLNHVSVLEALKKYKRLYSNDDLFRSLAIKLKDQWSKHSNMLS